jgi:hypothetical protein
MLNAIKWLVLVIVCVIAASMMFPKKLREKFVDNVDSNTAKYYDTISILIQTYLLRNPEQYELERYRRIMSYPKDVDPVIDAIKTTDEYKNLIKATPNSNANASLTPYIQKMSGMSSTSSSETRINKVVQDATMQQRTDMYREIINVYDTNLHRMPSMRELNYYTYRMLTDQAFNKRKLELILQASREYEIMQKNQTNVVNGHLEGDMTDAQITLKVRGLYEQVFDEQPDAEIERFMKYKYREYELSDARLLGLLKMLKNLDERKIDIMSITMGGGNSGVTMEEEAEIHSPLHNANAKNKRESQAASVNSHTSLTNTNNESRSFNASSTSHQPTIYHNNSRIYNIINPSQEELASILDKVTRENNEEQKMPCINPYDEKYAYKDELYETLKREQRVKTKMTRHPDCTWDKNAEEKELERQYRERNKLAEYQESRNLDEMRSSCARNTYFLNVDDEFEELVQPSQSEQMLGTPLKDAQNTKVGSMLPRFLYKELP